ncbi:MAG: hypothetical protein METHP_01944 [Methanoregula sp. SKADARSKE-2]|nr:MAG: hypothetical protein METHP_01944 [Methanoregula sp. SKADARSKE-2]
MGLIEMSFPKSFEVITVIPYKVKHQILSITAPASQIPLFIKIPAVANFSWSPKAPRPNNLLATLAQSQRYFWVASQCAGNFWARNRPGLREIFCREKMFEIQKRERRVLKNHLVTGSTLT